MGDPNSGVNGQTEPMALAAQKASDVADQVKNFMLKLQPAVEGVRSHWRGSPVGPFEAKHANWQTTCTNFITELERLEDAARKSSIAYVGADSDVMTAVNTPQPAAGYNAAYGGPSAV